MSANVRQAIADAANTVEGIHVHPYYRQGGKAGNGNIQISHVNFPNPFGGIVTWDVVILLPVDIESAQKRADELLPLLWPALSQALAVDDISFGTTSQDNRSGQPCLIATGHRAME